MGQDEHDKGLPTTGQLLHQDKAMLSGGGTMDDAARMDEAAMMDVAGGNWYDENQCPFCGVTFDDPRALRNHMDQCRAPRR